MIESNAPRRSPHPGMHAILDKLHNKAGVTAAELQLLKRQIEELETHGRTDAVSVAVDAAPPPVDRAPLSGHATRDGTAAFAGLFGKGSVNFYRAAQEPMLSSVGIGTYRGAMDSATDRAYIDAIGVALRAGVNLVDTSLNYRHQRAERCVGAALHRFVEHGGGTRDGVVVCSKGGYLTPGAVDAATLQADDVAGGMHAIAPAFLADQIRRSRENLAVETIDVYYLHNPETQLQFVSRAVFIARMRAAMALLEQAAADGAIRYYGTATWNGYRDGTLSLSELYELARQVGGERHRFRFVQLPFNLGMREARQSNTQEGRSVLDVAQSLGMSVIASASLLQARLSRDLPPLARTMPGLRTDSQRAIQFVRSAPGITAALVGMRDASHVEQNVGVARVGPLDAAAFSALESSV